MYRYILVNLAITPGVVVGIEVECVCVCVCVEWSGDGDECVCGAPCAVHLSDSYLTGGPPLCSPGSIPMAEDTKQ